MSVNPRNEFATPGAAYRGKPFWAWNGKLDPEELRRQIRVMGEMGLGGFFMHSRVGLDTAYLSDDWFECIDACIDEAKKQKMEAWLYDEDRWPSGAAGGLVTKNPKYRARRLTMYEFDKPAGFSWSKETLAAFTATVKGYVASGVCRLAKGKKPKTLARGESILAFVVEEDSCSSWYNGQTYLDTMNHEAVREFIKVTHKEYEKRCGKDLGKTVPGIFTDEPNHGGVIAGHGSGTEPTIPWTPDLPKFFKKRYGYDILDHLPEVFFDVDGVAVSPARWQYHDCKTFLFVDAFARQIGEWCDKTGMQHTGHVLSEDMLSHQMHVVGSALRFYEYMQAPGMDLLTEHWRVYDVAKGVSSVARQFGRTWRLTETYGCTGWDFPFAGHKMLGDWQTALGINLRAQHLTWYTMDGQAKRDFPASINYQSPWWPHYRKVEDYFARLNVVATAGAEVRDILVLFPVESAWVRCNMFLRRGGPTAHSDGALDHAGRPLPSLDEINLSMIELRDTLLQNHLDFDYGDEEMLSRHARVSKTKDGPTLRFAKAAYKAVVVPPMVTIRASTLKILERFHAAGGTVVFTGKPAPYVDAIPSEDAGALAKSCTRAPAKGARLATALAPLRRVSVADAKGAEIPPALYLLREDASAFYLFVCNPGHSPAQLRASAKNPFGDDMARDHTAGFEDVTISLAAETAGAPEEWDSETGARYAADARFTKKDGWKVKTELPPSAGRVFVFPKKKSTGKLSKRPGERVRSTKTLKKKTWDMTLTEANVLVLNWAEYAIGGKKKGRDEILEIDTAARTALGVAPRGGQMVQPWAREKKAKEKTVPVRLTYSFDAKTVPSGELFFGIEHPERFRITVNGHALSIDADAGWWTDLSLRRIPVDPATLRLGRNVIELETDYAESHGLEYVYLLGNFGASVKGLEQTITALTSSLKIGDWVKQGLPFYSGSVVYRTTAKLSKPRAGTRLLLRTPGYCGAAVRVLVDGEEAGVAAWAPNEVDLTAFADGKAHELGIEVLGHRRNSHGPFHLSELWPAWTGPDSFYVEKKRYRLVPCGLMKDPQLVVKG